LHLRWALPSIGRRAFKYPNFPTSSDYHLKARYDAIVGLYSKQPLTVGKS